MSKHVQKQNTLTWYGRLPVSVLANPSLSTSSKLVYAALAAHVWQGDTARVGQRRIAKLTTLSLSTVNAAIRELVDMKLIVPFGEGQSRRMYALLSPVFSQRQGKQDIIVSAPSGGQRLASVRKTA